MLVEERKIKNLFKCVRITMQAAVPQVRSKISYTYALLHRVHSGRPLVGDAKLVL